MDGLRDVWSLIGEFLQLLPAEVVMAASFAFVGFLILGILRWFK